MRAPGLFALQVVGVVQHSEYLQRLGRGTELGRAGISANPSGCAGSSSLSVMDVSLNWGGRAGKALVVLTKAKSSGQISSEDKCRENCASVKELTPYLGVKLHSLFLGLHLGTHYCGFFTFLLFWWLLWRETHHYAHP